MLYFAIRHPQAARRSVSDSLPLTSVRGRFGYWKAGFGSRIVYPEFPPRALLLIVSPQKNNIKAVVMVWRWQVPICARAIQKHK